jgi:hypothetical protein
MTFDIPQAGMQLAAHMLASLSSDSRKVKALALSEGKHLAYGLARIAELLGNGQISAEEAAALARVQRDASESVLASLADVSRVAAHRAVGRALKGVIGIVDGVIGVPLVAGALKPKPLP